MAQGTGAGPVLLGAAVVGRAVKITGFSVPPCPPLLGGSDDPVSLAGSERQCSRRGSRDGSRSEEHSATVRHYCYHYMPFYGSSDNHLAETKAAAGRKWLAQMALCEPSVLGRHVVARPSAALHDCLAC